MAINRDQVPRLNHWAIQHQEDKKNCQRRVRKGREKTSSMFSWMLNKVQQREEVNQLCQMVLLSKIQ
jgi:hypothetical protein